MVIEMKKYFLDINDTNAKYIQIYNHIKKLIIDKDIKVGEKLPAIRKLATEIGVNNATIVKVYELLENEGYIYKIIGSGTFVSNLKNRTKKVLNSDIIHFDSGNPSTEIFPIKDFKYAINLALENEGSSIFEYDEGLGDEGLRKKIVTYLENINIHTNKDNIQIISGAQQGIDIVCKGLINYSDIVFVEEPTYNGEIEVFKGRGAKIIQ